MPYPRLDNFKIKSRTRKNVLYTTYAAEHCKSGQHVSLKLFRKKCINEIDTQKFANFIQLFPYLDDSSTCKIFRHGEDRNYYYIATEPVQGELLLSSKQKHPSLSDSYYSTLIDIFLKIVLVVRHAHLRGIVHGFLHPDCIYVLSDGSLKIDDFGLHLLVSALFGEGDHKLGKLKHFIAPEVYARMEKIDGRADVYSLGVMLLQFLTGYLPPNLEKAITISKQQLLPATMEVLLSKSIQQNPEQRFKNCKEFVKSLKLLKRDLSGSIEEFDRIEAEYGALLSYPKSGNDFAEETPNNPTFGQRLLDIFRGTDRHMLL